MRHRKALLLMLPALGLTACNAVLGIEEPDEGASSGAAGQSNTTTSGGSSGSGSGGTMAATIPANDGSAAVDPTAFTWAEWPMPNPASLGLPNAQSYDTTSFAGVVIDSITSLQWQQAVDENSYTFADASTYCAGLTLTGGGWRLPSRIEVLSLVDYTSPNPYIDTNAFPDTPAEIFWTSSAFAGDPTFAWHVNFKFGNGFADKSEKTLTHRTRCIR
jgi:hypothetical protein